MNLFVGSARPRLGQLLAENPHFNGYTIEFDARIARLWYKVDF